MEFRRIEYFLVLAEKLNYSKAAMELCISSQALTKQINILEEELETRLFDRTTRSVALTEDGEMCREAFAALKTHYDETINTVRRNISGRNRSINVGLFAPLPRNEFLNPVITSLVAKFPDIDFEIITDNMDGLRDRVKSGEIDMALTNAPDFEDWLGCETVNFKTMPANIVVSEKHQWVKDKKKEISELDMREGSILLLIKHDPYEFNSFYRRIKTKDRVMVKNFDTMLMELEKGKTYAVFPLAFNDYQHSRFVCFGLPDKYKFNFRTMCAISKSNKNPDVKKVFEFIKKTRDNYKL